MLKLQSLHALQRSEEFVADSRLPWRVTEKFLLCAWELAVRSQQLAWLVEEPVSRTDIPITYCSERLHPVAFCTFFAGLEGVGFLDFLTPVLAGRSAGSIRVVPARVHPSSGSSQ